MSSIQDQPLTFVLTTFAIQLDLPSLSEGASLAKSTRRTPNCGTGIGREFLGRRSIAKSDRGRQAFIWSPRSSKMAVVVRVEREQLEPDATSLYEALAHQMPIARLGDDTYRYFPLG